MEFSKLSLGSPMAQNITEEDDDLLNESGDDLEVDQDATREQLDSRQGAPVEQFAFLPEEAFACDYVPKGIYHNQGPILQFINQNCADAATVIGGVRLPPMDVRTLPAYLSRNKQLVRAHAVRQLHQHLVDSQSAAGATESLGPDDYSMTFMLASVSKEGRALHPLGRQEGPLLFCMFPGLNQPVRLFDNADGSPEEVHVVNVYIHLYDVNRRRRAIIDRAAKAEEARVNALATPPVIPPAAVKRKGPVISQAAPCSLHGYPSGPVARQQQMNNIQRPPPPPSSQYQQPQQHQQRPAQPPLPPPQPQVPRPPQPEQYPPLAGNQGPINWPMAPRLPEFPDASG